MADTEPDTYVALEGDALAAAKELNSITVVEEPALEERKVKAKALLANYLTKPGFKAGGADKKPLVTVRNGSSTFDPEKAKEALPEELFDSICEPVVDLSQAEAILSPAEYAAICKMVPDAELARQQLAPGRLALLTHKVPSKDLAEQMLPPQLLAKCKKVGDPIIMAEQPKKGGRR